MIKKLAATSCIAPPECTVDLPFMLLQPFLCIYGGDPAHVPTIGAVMKVVKGQYTCHVLAIQAAGKHEDWVDSVFV